VISKKRQWFLPQDGAQQVQEEEVQAQEATQVQVEEVDAEVHVQEVAQVEVVQVEEPDPPPPPNVKRVVRKLTPKKVTVCVVLRIYVYPVILYVCACVFGTSCHWYVGLYMCLSSVCM
jgi:hypothetical protein